MIPHHKSYNMYTFMRFHALAVFTVSFTLISQQVSKHWDFNSAITTKKLSFNCKFFFCFLTEAS